MKRLVLLLALVFVFSCSSDDDGGSSLPENALLTYRVTSTGNIQSVTYKSHPQNTITTTVNSDTWELTQNYSSVSDAFVSAFMSEAHSTTVEIYYDGELIRSQGCSSNVPSTCSAATDF